jgi:hypothetical protein
MPSTQRIVLSLAVALTLSGPALGDEVTEQMDAARKAYESGELRSAVDTLNFTVAKIQEKITAGLLLLLPEPLPGWQADPAQSESAGLATMITGTTLSRRYYRDDGADVTLRLMADSPMLGMLSMFLSSPFMMQADPNSKPFALKGQRGVLKHTPGSNEYEITLMVGNRILIQGESRGVADEKTLQHYLEALDLSAVQKAFNG